MKNYFYLLVFLPSLFLFREVSGQSMKIDPVTEKPATSISGKEAEVGLGLGGKMSVDVCTTFEADGRRSKMTISVNETSSDGEKPRGTSVSLDRVMDIIEKLVPSSWRGVIVSEFDIDLGRGFMRVTKYKSVETNVSIRCGEAGCVSSYAEIKFKP